MADAKIGALQWDKSEDKIYETGVDHAVLYLYDDSTKAYDRAVVWNGINSITEKPSGGEANAIWADNIKYLNLMSAEEFGASITAYTYPDEFERCDGSVTVNGATIGLQGRKTFGLAYRTRIGEENNSDLGYKLHLIWGCKASPSERAYNTINDSPDALQFSWEITTTPVPFESEEYKNTYKPTSYIVINSTTADEAKLKALEDILFGTGTAGTGTDAILPTPDVVLQTLQPGA